MDVDPAECLVHDVHVHRPGVVHVEAGGLAVADDEAGVADRTVGRRAQRDDHDIEIATVPVRDAVPIRDAVLDRVLGLEEPRETQFLEFATQVGHRVVGQQYGRVLVDVLGEVLGVVVILVQVRDVEVVAVAEGVPVEAGVVGEREPRPEVGRVHPRIAQDRARRRLDVESGVTDAGDLHAAPSPTALAAVHSTSGAGGGPTGVARWYRRSARLHDRGPRIPHRHRRRACRVLRAGPEVHRDRRGEHPARGWRGHRDQPHRLPRLHLRRPAGPHPEALHPVHGEEGGLRQQDHRPDHAVAQTHPGRPRRRAPIRSTRRSRALRRGELVGVYPEATISRSFEIKDFKSGAARMASTRRCR